MLFHAWLLWRSAADSMVRVKSRKHAAVAPFRLENQGSGSRLFGFARRDVSPTEADGLRLRYTVSRNVRENGRSSYRLLFPTRVREINQPGAVFRAGNRCALVGRRRVPGRARLVTASVKPGREIAPVREAKRLLRGAQARGRGPCLPARGLT